MLDGSAVPTLSQYLFAVVFPILVVESVHHFVADDGADGAEIECGGKFNIDKRFAQDADIADMQFNYIRTLCK